MWVLSAGEECPRLVGDWHPLDRVRVFAASLLRRPAARNDWDAGCHVALGMNLPPSGTRPDPS